MGWKIVANPAAKWTVCPGALLCKRPHQIHYTLDLACLCHLCKKVGFGCTWAAFYSKLCPSLQALWTRLWPPAHSLFHIASNKSSPLRYFAMTLSISLADHTLLPLAIVRDLIRDIKSSPGKQKATLGEMPDFAALNPMWRR